MGDKVVYETNGTYGILFTYDYDGTLISFNYDYDVTDDNVGVEYFYLRNQQGDITLITNSAGDVVIRYRYDAYGNMTATPTLGYDDLTLINPYTYRGYRYDAEIGLYYLNSRYYNPQIGRFINGDGLLGETGDLLSTNMYGYCANNPIVFSSYCGISGSGNSVSTMGQTEVSSGGGFINQILLSGSFRNNSFFGKGSITSVYADFQFRFQKDYKKGSIKVGFFGKMSVINASGEIGVGDDEFGIVLKGVADFCTWNAFAGVIINPETNDYFIGIQGGAAVFTARGGVQITVFGIPVEVGGQVEALSVNGQFGVGFKEGEFYISAGASLLVGANIYVRVKFW